MTSPAVQNLGYSDDGVIAMDAQRARRLHHLLGEIVRQVNSLRIVSDLFPSVDLESPNADPRATVKAFCAPISADLDRLYLMLENEDEQEGEGGK